MPLSMVGNTFSSFAELIASSMCVFRSILTSPSFLDVWEEIAELLALLVFAVNSLFTPVLVFKRDLTFSPFCLAFLFRPPDSNSTHISLGISCLSKPFSGKLSNISSMFSISDITSDCLER